MDRRRYVGVDREKMEKLERNGRRAVEMYLLGKAYEHKNNRRYRRRDRRLPPPHERAEAIFLKTIYNIIYDVYIRNAVDKVRYYVEFTHYRTLYKCSKFDIIDWVMRICNGDKNSQFNYDLHEDKLAHGLRLTREIDRLGNHEVSRFSCVLRFAFRHQIDPIFVPMFIDYCGGYEVIRRYIPYRYEGPDPDWKLRLMWPRLHRGDFDMSDTKFRRQKVSFFTKAMYIEQYEQDLADERDKRIAERLSTLSSDKDNIDGADDFDKTGFK